MKQTPLLPIFDTKSKPNVSVSSNIMFKQPLRLNTIGQSKSSVNPAQSAQSNQLNLTESTSDSFRIYTKSQKQTELFQNLDQSQANIRSPQELFNTSKLYYKYLTSVKIKMANSSNIGKDKTKDFSEYYTNATILYEDIRKEWFWISNGESLQPFYNKQKINPDDIEAHKTNLINNYNMLKTIAKIYGFDIWFAKHKTKNNKKLSDLSNLEISSSSNMCMDSGLNMCMDTSSNISLETGSVKQMALRSVKNEITNELSDSSLRCAEKI
jgi:hypothetical protein